MILSEQNYRIWRLLAFTSRMSQYIAYSKAYNMLDLKYKPMSPHCQCFLTADTPIVSAILSS